MKNEHALPGPTWRIALSAALVVSLTIAMPTVRSHAQQTPASPQQSASKGFTKEKLEQLAAPIALYPDALMAQVLMGSTYPLEVVQAARWAAANPKVTGKALESAMQTQPWDASIKSLVAFPSALQMMNEKLDWTQQLGDAFLGQQQELLAAVQTLRAKAEAAGSLTTTKEQKVTKSSSGSTSYIVIEPQNPSVVYVPAYNPSVVYGTWPYPAYPPYYYYPPGYVASRALWYGAGVAAGAALWGNCNWGNNQVNLNINNYNQFNRTNISNTNWQHNVEHRKGVPYSNANIASQYRNAGQNTASREQYRGHAEAGRQALNTPTTQQAARQATQPKASKQPAGSASRPQPSPTQQQRQGQTSKSTQQRQAAAFDGVGSGGQVRKESARGQASRSASQVSRQAPAARSGGGGGGRAGRGGGGRRR